MRFTSVLIAIACAGCAHAPDSRDAAPTGAAPAEARAIAAATAAIRSISAEGAHAAALEAAPVESLGGGWAAALVAAPSREQTAARVETVEPPLSAPAAALTPWELAALPAPETPTTPEAPEVAPAPTTPRAPKDETVATVETALEPPSIEYDDAGALQIDRDRAAAPLIFGVDPALDIWGDPLATRPPTFAVDQEPAGEKLTLPELVAEILARNYDVRIAGAKAEAAEAAVAFAEAALYPTFDLDISNSFSHTHQIDQSPHEDKRRHRVQVASEYKLYDFGVRALDVRRAESSEAQSRFAERAEREATVETVVGAVLTILQADASITAMGSHISRLEELQGLIGVLADGGGGTQADVERVASRIDQTRTAKIKLESDRETAVNRFAKLARVPFSALAAPPVEMFQDLGTDPSQVNLNVNPEVAALGYQIQSLESQYRSLRRENWPTVTLGALAAYDVERIQGVDETLIGEVSLSVSQSLGDGGANAASRRQTIAQLREAELKRAKLLDELREEADNAVTFRATEIEKNAILDNRVRSLRDIVALYTEQFRVGQRTILELLESEADLLTAELERVSHNFDRARARIGELTLSGDLVAALTTPAR